MTLRLWNVITLDFSSINYSISFWGKSTNMRLQYHSGSFVPLDATRQVYIWRTMRRYERDTKGSFLIQFWTEESWMVLGCLSVKSITHWCGKTCSVQTMGVGFFVSVYIVKGHPDAVCTYTHTNNNRPFTLLLPDFNIKYAIFILQVNNSKRFVWL